MTRFFDPCPILPASQRLWTRSALRRVESLGWGDLATTAALIEAAVPQCRLSAFQIATVQASLPVAPVLLTSDTASDPDERIGVSSPNVLLSIPPETAVAD